MVRQQTVGVVLALGVAVGTATAALPAAGQTFDEALALAYTNNPDLRAARANLRSVNEGVPQARGGWLPTVTANLTAGYTSLDSENNDTNTSTDSDSFPTTGSLSVSQPLYTGGATAANVRRNRALVQAERASLFESEQNVLRTGAQAYVDVIRFEAVLDLQISNLQRLIKQLEATRDRFAVGEVTRTDVAQAEARVARAEADRAQAAGDLTSARVIFERVIGIVPAQLTQPDTPPGLPTSREEAVDIGTESNFQLVQAKFQEVSAIEQIDRSFGSLLPSADLVFSAQQSYDTSGGDNESTSVTLEAQVSVPIYQQGIVYSQVRAAKEEANRRRILVESVRRNVVDVAARSFEEYETALARIDALQAEVDSQQVALEGVEQEATVGARTVLDVLDAEQELLDAQVNLVSAQRNALIAAYELLTAVGRMTASNLRLPVELYDFNTPYLETERRLFGTNPASGLP